MARQPSLFPSFRAATAGAPTPTAAPLLFDDLPRVAITSGRQSIWRTEARTTMRRVTEELRRLAEREGEDGIGERWAAALRRRYPDRARAKRIARDMCVEIRTAEGWLAGQAPQVKALWRAALVHGPAIVTEVLLPGTSLDQQARVDSGLLELEQRLDALRREISTLRGSDGT
jgi:hypothetical protein